MSDLRSYFVHTVPACAVLALLVLAGCSGPPPAEPGGAAEGSAPAVLMLVTGAGQMSDGKQTGLWLEEFAVPYEAFRAAGFSIEVATLQGGAAPVDPRSAPEEAQAEAWEEASTRLKQTRRLGDLDLSGFDAIFIPGGHGVMFDLASSQEAAAAIEAFARSERVVAAVCHGPGALVQVKGPDGAPLVEGRKVAAFTNSEEEAVKLTEAMPFLLETRLRELGAELVQEADFKPCAVRDGNLITGQNPASSAETARLTVDALRERVESLQ